ncbi:transferrin-binding protein-like solute binding protein [Pasteurellaceae bacterium TAE3-ERU1]|nr:transferrin-binding protein-like solute binding protein [Pasteurellaceae bacterium TAE3-ERU1]
MQKYAAFSVVSLSLAVVACSGGSDVSAPTAVADIPTAKAFTQKQRLTPVHTVAPKQGKIFYIQSDFSKDFSYENAEGFAYQAPDGKIYRFTTFATMIVPSGFYGKSLAMRTKHTTQALDNGGQIFVCCEGSPNSTSFPAMNTGSDFRYGVYVSPQGETDFFVGGKLADKEKFNAWAEKGRASYEVLGVRYRNNAPVTSAYTPAGEYNKDEVKVRSVLVADFDQKKLEGKIVGNKDFGGDINFNDVAIKDNTFAGKVESEGQQGRVDGAFFGNTAWGSFHVGDKIGGKAEFDNKALNAAFGGAQVDK